MSDYYKTKIGAQDLSPETQMMGYGYDPHLSEGSLKPPVFLTSTFVFPSAQAGKDFFDYASGRKIPSDKKHAGLVYSRINNPNLEVLEDRLALWDNAEMAAVFSSGMSAITTTLFAYLRPNDVLIASQPLYGGTEGLIENVLTQFGVKVVHIENACLEDDVKSAFAIAAKSGRIGAIMVETPGNPTNAMVDLALIKNYADEYEKSCNHRPPIICDNTFLGPIYQNALEHGADISLYSLTKYVGGHSDVVAGGICGATKWITPVKGLRILFGTQLDPNSSWMLMRSLETLKLRMEKSNENAKLVAAFLKSHSKIQDVYYLDYLPQDWAEYKVFKRQCAASGSTFSFDIKGGEQAAFAFLDNLKIIHLAVSLGGTETLASHPASMTHSGVPLQIRQKLGIGDNLVRISVGIENPQDIIADLSQALDAV